MPPYTPKPGSVADYVIQRLRAPGAPERISSCAIQRALGKPSAANVTVGVPADEFWTQWKYLEPVAE